MENNNRAKQFMPFDALTGLREALKQKEKIKISKRSQTEEELLNLNNLFPKLKKGDIVEVEHFKNEEYIKTKGMISKIDITEKNITIVKEKINFKDIIRMEK